MQKTLTNRSPCAAPSAMHAPAGAPFSVIVRASPTPKAPELRCAQTGKLAFALPLLVSFSVGLSAVLALIGVFVVLLHRLGRGSFRDRAWLRFLPTASAVLLMGMGLWMARDAWKAMSS